MPIQCKKWLRGSLLVFSWGALTAASAGAGEQSFMNSVAVHYPDAPGEPEGRYISKGWGEYWTPERMNGATPEEMPMNFDGSEGVGKAFSWRAPLVEGMEFQVSDPVPPLVHHGLARAKSGTWGAPFVSYWPTNGRLFFKNSAGEDKYCTASAINSPSKRLLVTAAHCVHGGPGKSWHTQVRFSPYYYDQYEPYGTFPVYAMRAMAGWIQHGGNQHGFNRDVAILTMQDNQYGWRLVDWVGGHGFSYGAFDATRIFNNIWLFGYPKNMDNGQIPKSCSGTSEERTHMGYAFVSMSDCNFGHGASGGPWLTGFDAETGLGTLRTISSWVRKNSETDFPHINGPHFDVYINYMYLMADNDWLAGQ